MLDVLVADDDANVRDSVEVALQSRGHQVTLASDGAEAADLLREHVFDLAICDVRMPRLDGLTLMRRIRREAPGTAVVIMTTFARISDVVGSMRDGAVDYVTKPFDPDEFMTRVVEPIAERRAFAAKFEAARAELGARRAGVAIVAKSPRMASIAARIPLLGSSDASVLITGEAGTGKELLARTIHALGSRREGPLVVVHGAELLGLMEATLSQDISIERSGRDAWFHAASEGTLLIDDIERVAPRAQAQLLRLLDDPRARARRGPSCQPLGVRVISLSRGDLTTAVEAGEFRDSLYYRLDGIQLEVPPLRDRQADLFPLVTELLHELVPTGTTVPGISPKAWQAIEAHEFSGNVRELRWVLEQALAASNGAEIGPSHLPRALRRAEG